MTHEDDRAALSRLVGRWRGTLLHGIREGQAAEEAPATCDARWMLGGRFVEMTLRAGAAGDAWSALIYIGHERLERRHVFVALGPGDRRVTTRLGAWMSEADRLVLTSAHSRAVCDLTTAGVLGLELFEDAAAGQDYVRFRGVYGPAGAQVYQRAAHPRPPRRFVIA